MFEAFKFKCIEKTTAATKTGKARQEHHNIFILIIKIRNEQCLNGWTDIRTLLGADRRTSAWSPRATQLNYQQQQQLAITAALVLHMMFLRQQNDL